MDKHIKPRWNLLVVFEACWVDATWAMVDDYQFLGEVEMF